MKPIAKRIAQLEASIRLKPSKASNDYRGIPMTDLINEMDSDERNSMRQALLFAQDNDDYKTQEEFKELEALAKVAMDKAHNRLINNKSRHLSLRECSL
jgi:hypothetical protein